MKSVWVIAGCLLLSACAQANAPAAPQATETTAKNPAPSTSTVAQALAATGIQITGTMEAPKGFHGYIGTYHGHSMPVYLTPDGAHLMVGSLFDLQGHDLTAPAMSHVSASQGAELWQTLSTTPTIVAGNPHAKRIVYAFMDTDCPFCHDFWEASQEWLKAGDVQMRIVLVAVISPDSVPRGGAVLDAKDPAAAWAANEREFGPKRPKITAKPSAAALHTLGTNNALMQQFGFQGTPTIVYKDAQGQVHTLQGMPQSPQILQDIFAG